MRINILGQALLNEARGSKYDPTEQGQTRQVVRAGYNVRGTVVHQIVARVSQDGIGQSQSENCQCRNFRQQEPIFHLEELSFSEFQKQ